MKSGLIGKLTRDCDNDDDAHWTSEAIRLPAFSGSAIPVRYQGEAAEHASFDKALANLLNPGAELQSELSNRLYQQWVDYNDLVGLTDGLSVFREIEKPEQWHRAALANGEWLLRLDNPAKVWEYLELETVLVRQDGPGFMLVELHFKCGWDEEHGVQVHLEGGNRLLD